MVSPLTDMVYERLSNSTLDELAFYFEELPEFGKCPEDYDVEYGVCELPLCVAYHDYIAEWSINHQGWR